MARATAAAGAHDGGVQQRGHPVRRDRRDRRPLVAAGLPAPGPRPRRADAGPSRRGRRRRRRTHRRHPVVGDQVRRRATRSGTRSTRRTCGSNFDADYDDASRVREGTRPRPGGSRLAHRAHRAAGGGEGGAAPRGRAAVRGRRRRSGVGVQPRRPAAGPGDHHRRRAAGVVAAVRGRREVYVDGGLRSGLDVLAALALGADAAFLGRLPLYALVDGAGRGVPHACRSSPSKSSEGLGLAGCRSPARPAGSSTGQAPEPCVPGHDDPICTPRQESSNVLRVARARREARPVRSGFRPRGGHLQLTPQQVSERSPPGGLGLSDETVRAEA